MIYKASLSKLAKGITIGAILIVSAVIATTIIFESLSLNQKLMAIILPIIALLLAYLYAPKSYTLSESSLTINKVAGKINIELNNITDIQKIPKLEGATIRTFGSGGFFGFYGKFYNSKIGKITMYATRSDNRLLIKTNDGQNIIISPDDISLFDVIHSKLQK
jgi:hypothetical protein